MGSYWSISHQPFAHWFTSTKSLCVKLKLRQIEEISFLVKSKMHPVKYKIEKQKLKKYSVVALEKSEKINLQICLEGLHPRQEPCLCLLYGGELSRTVSLRSMVLTAKPHRPQNSEQSNRVRISARHLRYFLYFTVEKITFQNGNASISIVSLSFQSILLLYSSKYFRKRAHIRDSFVLQLWSNFS